MSHKKINTVKRFVALLVSFGLLLPSPAYSSRPIGTRVSQATLNSLRSELRASFEASNPFLRGVLPTAELLQSNRVDVNATDSIAAGLFALNLVGSGDRDKLDAAAQDIFVQVHKNGGLNLRVLWFEGAKHAAYGEDVELGVFEGGQTISFQGVTETSTILADVTENTSAMTAGKIDESGSGGSSLYLTGKLVEAFGAGQDELGAALIIGGVPLDKMNLFSPSQGGQPLDPDNPVVENIDRLLQANGLSWNEAQVFIMNRKRAESEYLTPLREQQQKFPGLEVTLIKNGSYEPALLATLGRKEGKYPVFVGTSGSTEAAANYLQALVTDGAVVGFRLYSPFSKNVADAVGSMSKTIAELTPEEISKAKMAGKIPDEVFNSLPKDVPIKYLFTEDRKGRVRAMRPEDGDEITSPQGKLFHNETLTYPRTADDVSGIRLHNERGEVIKLVDGLKWDDTILSASTATILAGTILNVPAPKEVAPGEYLIWHTVVERSGGKTFVWNQPNIINWEDLVRLSHRLFAGPAPQTLPEVKIESQSLSTLQTQLQSIARRMATPKGGVYAADESVGSVEKRFKLLTPALENTPENRQRWRSMIITTPGLKEAGIDAMILDKDTLDNVSPEGKKLVQILLEAGIVPGLKTDAGLIPDTLSPYPAPEGKLTEGEVVPNPAGLEKLPVLLERAKTYGIEFTKWRVTTYIDTTRDLPTEDNIRRNMEVLAKQAKITQLQGLVPIVEPEILYEGAPANHDIATAARVQRRVLEILFEELKKEGVFLGGLVLKTSMVLPGKNSTESVSAEIIGRETFKVLSVPSEVPAIVFLSGGQKDDQANENLNAVSLARLSEPTKAPWEVTYSFGRGLQLKALLAWNGQDENLAAAQVAAIQSARTSQAARLGRLEQFRSEARLGLGEVIEIGVSTLKLLSVKDGVAEFAMTEAAGRSDTRMLTFERQRDESIIIGDNIVVTIVDIRRDQVRIGIQAPIEIPVHRQEVYEAIQRENEEARQRAKKGQGPAARAEARLTSQPTMDLSSLVLPQVSEAKRSGVLASFTSNFNEALILDDPFVLEGGLAFVGSIFQGPIVVRTNNPAVEAQVEAFKKEFPQSLISVASTAQEAKEELNGLIKTALSFLGGVRAGSFSQRAIVTEDSSTDVRAELIKELGERQVSIISRRQFHQWVQSAGLVDAVAQLVAGFREVATAA